MIGSTISHYKIDEKLGEGGMGVVYKATDTQLDRPVALKFLPPQFTASDEDRTRFIREAKAASSLDHPNICTVFEAGQSDDGQMFMAMAYYDGSSLKDVIAKGKIPVEEALNIAIQIAEALKAADSKGIVHRDVKPGNIIITPDGVAKLLDFGLASQANWATLTRSNSTLGTAAYMAPEQATGEGADHRSDLWSLGVVLYQMLTGKLPFRGDHEAALLYSIVNEEPEDIYTEKPDVPLEIAHVVLRLLEKDPDDRYQSAGEVLGELKRFAHRSDKTKSVVRTHVRTYGMRAWVRKWGVAVSSLISLGVIAILVVQMSDGDKESPVSSYKYTPILPENDAAMGKWSPDGSSIAYLQGSNEDIKIKVRNLGSQRSTLLTSVPLNWTALEAMQMEWAPDGKSITYRERFFLKRVSIVGGEPVRAMPFLLYESEFAPNNSVAFILAQGKWIGPTFTDSAGLFITGPNGENPRRYINDPIKKRSLNPTIPPIVKLSPDGSKIALSFFGPPTLRNEFWILPWPDTQGAQPRRVFQDIEFGYPHYFEWLPDSRRVLVNHKYMVWVGDTEEGTLKRISASARKESMRSVSRDGKRILIDDFDPGLDVVELPLDGSPMRTVVGSTVEEYSATTSFDGSSMAYVTKQAGRTEIWVQEGDAQPRPIVVPSDLEAPDSLFFIWRAKISPDGQRVAYAWKRNFGDEEGTRLSVSTVEGGTPFSPLPDSASLAERTFCWSPDSKRLYAQVLWKNQRESPSILPVGGGEIFQLPDTAGTMTDAMWSPDGRWIALGQVGRSFPQGRILLMSPDGMTARVLDAPERLSTHFCAYAWARDSKHLYFAASTSPQPKLTEIDVERGTSRLIATYVQTMHFGPLNGNATGSLSKDGKGILVTAMIPSGGIYILDGAL